MCVCLSECLFLIFQKLKNWAQDIYNGPAALFIPDYLSQLIQAVVALLCWCLSLSCWQTSCDVDAH